MGRRMPGFLAEFTGPRQLIRRAGKPAIDYSDWDFVENREAAGAGTIVSLLLPSERNKGDQRTTD
jgi:hypothetical protein